MSDPTPGDARRRRQQWTGSLITAGLVLLVPSMVWLFFADAPPFLRQPTPLGCEPPPEAAATAIAGTGEAQAAVPLELGGVQEQRLALGRTRDARETTATLTVGSGADDGAAAATATLAAGTPLEAEQRSFARADGASLHDDAIEVWAQVIGQQVDLTLCVRPMYDVVVGQRDDGESIVERRVVDPGVYAGTVLVRGDGVLPSTVPFVVTRSFDRWWSVVALAVLASGAAVVWIYILRSGEGGYDKECRRFTVFGGDFVDWLRRPASIISIAAGSVGAAAVYSSTYLKAEDWGATAPTYLSFVGAVFTAFLTAGTAGKLAENMHHGGPTRKATVAEDHEREPRP